MLGVSPNRERLELMGEPRIETWVREAITPIVNDLGRKVHTTGATVMVADPEGTVVDVRGDRGVQRLLASVQSVPGAILAEDAVGTNAIGTAIEEGRGVQICSGEHFIDAFQGFTCSAVPIRHPLKRRIVAVLDITTREDLAGRTIADAVAEAARQMEEALYDRLTARERALLFYYLQEIRNSRYPVVASDGRTIIASDGAVRLLDQSDYPLLWRYVAEVLQTSKSFERDMTLASGRDVVLSATPRYDGGEPAGVVLKLKPLGKAVSASFFGEPMGDPFDDLLGNSRLWREAVELARGASSNELSVCIVGEPGTGKYALARAMALHTGKRFATVECVGVDMRSRRWIAHLQREASSVSLLILRHVDALRPAAREALTALLDSQGLKDTKTISTVRIARGRRNDLGLPQDFLDRLGAVTISLPRLEERIEDIPLLARAFLARNGQSGVRIHPGVLQVLEQAEWPDNIRQLENTLMSALMLVRGSEMTVQHLPRNLITHHALARLSRLQQIELEALRTALAEAGGNRRRAAELLGISRSTLYRKLDSYRLIGINLEI